jgi:glycosyltransferase involved in cell wall biosynthesis
MPNRKTDFMTAPAISVIVPVYNRRSQLERALRSVLKQTCDDFECIVVDDCSSDDCASLPQFDHPRISYVRLNYRSGVARARNIGVQHTHAFWIAFLDSDDEWFPEKLRKQIEYINSNPTYRILQSCEWWIRNGTRVNPPKTHLKRKGDLFGESLKRCMITPSSVVLQKTLFEETGGFNETLPACEDYDLWLRITAHYPVGLVDEPLLIRYAGHDDQLSATVPILDRFRIRSILDLLEKNNLTLHQKTLCIEHLREKTRIVAHGYLKRGKKELYERYIAIEKRLTSI